MDPDETPGDDPVRVDPPGGTVGILRVLRMRETVLPVSILQMRLRAVKQIHELPFRPWLALLVLYLASFAVTATAAGIAASRGFGLGVYLGLALEVAITVHVLRRA